MDILLRTSKIIIAVPPRYILKYCNNSLIIKGEKKTNLY